MHNVSFLAIFLLKIYENDLLGTAIAYFLACPVLSSTAILSGCVQRVLYYLYF